MKALAGQKNLYLLGNCYYFRKSIPRNLLPYFGRIEYKKSLGTRYFREACRKAWSMNATAEWFFEVIATMAQSLTAEKLQELVKGHFEMCLLQAEDSYFLEKYLAPADGIFEPQNLVRMLERSSDRLAELRSHRASHVAPPDIQRVAERLLSQSDHSCPSSNPMFYELCSGITRAQLEAERINQAFLSSNERDGEIQDPYFSDCTNYFTHPANSLFWENRHFDYVPRSARKPEASMRLGEALEIYFAYKRTEVGLRDQSAQAQLEARTSKLKLFIAADAELEKLTHEDGWALREKIINLPNNTHHLSDDETLKVMAEGGSYTKISAATIGSYWQSFQIFFSFARKRRWIAESPLEDIKPNIKKEPAVLRRPFTKLELKQLFSSPLFTGHSTEHRERWAKGDILVKDGQFWVPLVGLYQGMRMGEILGLMKEDIQCEDSYNRASDRQFFAYRCKLEGTRVLWASDTGRWRNHPMDEVITYALTADAVTITQVYPDGSSGADTFSKAQLYRRGRNHLAHVGPHL